MDTQIHPSVNEIWNDFVNENEHYKSKAMPDSWHFCATKKDANECADLARNGIKQATSASLWWYTKFKVSLPKKGDLAIITDWDGRAKAIIEVTKTTRIPYHQMTEELAKIEGEGDQSLAYWKRVHWDYFSREMRPFGESPDKNMILIFEQFKVIWK